MVLPLALLGLGLGGAVGFLQGKANERKAEGQYQAFEQAMRMSPFAGTPQGESLLMQARSQMDNAGFFDWWEGKPNQGLARGTSFAQQSMFQQLLAQQQAAAAQQQWNIDTGMAESDQLQQEYSKQLGDFQEAQTAYLAAEAALQPGMNSADSVAALYRFFQVLEPGGIVRDGEADTFRGIGGSGQRFANILNGIMGEGLTDASRKEILNTITSQYRPIYQRAQRQKGFFDKRLQTLQERQLQFLDDPTGSLGIDWNQVLPGQPEPVVPQVVQPPAPQAAPTPGIPSYRDPALLPEAPYMLIDGQKYWPVN